MIDWTKIYKKYRGLWVAIKDDEKTVVASGNTLKKTQEEALKRGFKDFYLTKVPNKVVSFVG
ncbi:MAG: DUF5678 domain-containing protein [bacterium]|nr:DUF5678 domain-containing protein [bacterium]